MKKKQQSPLIAEIKCGLKDGFTARVYKDHISITGLDATLTIKNNTRFYIGYISMLTMENRTARDTIIPMLFTTMMMPSLYVSQNLMQKWDELLETWGDAYVAANPAPELTKEEEDEIIFAEKMKLIASGESTS